MINHSIVNTFRYGKCLPSQQKNTVGSFLRGLEIFYVAMLDDFEIIKLLQSVIHHWKGILLRYTMVSVVWQYMN